MIATSAIDNNSSGKASARLLGSTMSGVTELLIFHPVDTVAKRLMTNKTTVGVLYEDIVLLRLFSLY